MHEDLFPYSIERLCVKLYYHISVPNIYSTKNHSGMLWRHLKCCLFASNLQCQTFWCLKCFFLVFLCLACHLGWLFFLLFAKSDQVYHFSLICCITNTFMWIGILMCIICVLLSISTSMSYLMLHYPNCVFFGTFSINSMEAIYLLFAYITHFFMLLTMGIFIWSSFCICNKLQKHCKQQQATLMAWLTHENYCISRNKCRMVVTYQTWVQKMKRFSVNVLVFSICSNDATLWYDL